MILNFKFEETWMVIFIFVLCQFDQDFLENMEDFVTLDEVAEDEEEDLGDSDTIGTRSQHFNTMS